MEGDYPGWGQVGSYSDVRFTWECAELCIYQTHPACRSYEYSTTEKICNLNTVGGPTEGKYKDYAFCVASKKILTHTVVHDFNGHEVNRIHGLNGKKCYDKALNLVNNRHDFKGMYDFRGNFPYDDFFRKTHARLYFMCTINK